MVSHSQNLIKLPSYDIAPYRFDSDTRSKVKALQCQLNKLNMAEITVTAQIEVTFTVTVPDSKLKSFLEETENFDYWIGAECMQPIKYKKGYGIVIDNQGITNHDIDCIEKSNGVGYEWDGEKLVKDK
jgi:hypothetical protein